jgi:hypothetical protein
MSRCPDGSWLSLLGGVRVRVIDAQVTITTAAGSSAGRCRLVATLLDPARYPAGELVTLYRQRWEVETAYFELKSTILDGRVLRARTPAGVDQEVHALLVAYQVLRTAMADAAAAVPGADPDRASFSIALDAARDQVILAGGVITGTTVDLVGRIGERVVAQLMPARRLRTSPRVVKRAISKYNARGNIDRATRKATVNVEISPDPLTGGQLGISDLRRPSRPAAGEPARDDDAIGQFHVKCGQEGVQVGDHDGLQGPDVCENDAPMSCQGLFRLAWLVDFGAGEGIAFTGLLGADKTGRGRSGWRAGSY